MTLEEYVNAHYMQLIECDEFFTRDELYDIACEHLRNRDTVKQLVNDLEDNLWCEYWRFDASCWGYGATPLNTVEDVREFLLEYYDEKDIEL